MGLVVAALALVLAGCYEPSLRDCAVTCAAAEQCASGQVCGAEGYCVGETGARCGSGATVDAHVDALRRVDAIEADAADATFALHVTVMGHGSVTVVGGGSCTMDCTYALPRNSVVSATEMGAGNHAFQMWTTPNCAGQVPTCTFTLTAPQNLAARFE